MGPFLADEKPADWLAFRDQGPLRLRRLGTPVAVSAAMRSSRFHLAQCGTLIACASACQTVDSPGLLLGESQGVAVLDLTAQLTCDLSDPTATPTLLRLTFDIEGDALTGSVRSEGNLRDVTAASARREGKEWVFDELAVMASVDEFQFKNLRVSFDGEVSGGNSGTALTAVGDIADHCDIQGVSGRAALDVTPPVALLADAEDPHIPFEPLHVDFDEPVNADTLELNVYDDSNKQPIRFVLERFVDDAGWLRAANLIPLEGWTSAQPRIELKGLTNEAGLTDELELLARVSIQTLSEADYGMERGSAVWDGCAVATKVSTQNEMDDIAVSAPEGSHMLVCTSGGGYLEQALSVPKAAKTLHLQVAIFDSECHLSTLEPTTPQLIIRSPAGERSIPLSEVISEDLCSTGFRTERIELGANEHERIWLGLSFRNGAVRGLGLGSHRWILIDDFGFE